MNDDDSRLNIDRPSLQLLAALLLDRVGLKITPDGYYGLRLALVARMPALGLFDASEYVRRLRQLAGETELRALLPLVTVGKTEFFRDHRQFEGLEQVLIPKQLASARKEGRKMRIWSAGCATGEEPYSVAIVALERGAEPHEVDLWATDLNPAAIESATAGKYPTRRMVGVSEERLAKFFIAAGENYEAVPSLKKVIRFEGHNLAAPVFPMVTPGTLDLIMCRNVIIYFDQPTIRGLMDRFFDALRPGGVLLLGYSESLFRLATKFEMFEVSGSFAYRRPLPGAPPPPPPRPSAPIVAPRPSAPGAAYAGPIPQALPGRSSGIVPAMRITNSGIPGPFAPSASAPRPSSAGLLAIPAPAPSAPEARRTPVERLDKVIALIEKGEFGQALLGARRLSDDQPEDLAALLTLGNIHALMGNVDEARDLFNVALAKEPLCVEARLYLAIAAIQSGQPEAARVELTRALFLEPKLALGHYLLGQVQEKRGDLDAARRAYKNAISQRKAPPHTLIGHFPELPKTNEAIAQASGFRLAALSEA